MSDERRPEEPTRHYDRARRLERASAEVRWAAALDPARRTGLLGSLLATRGLRFAFFAILIATLASGVSWMAMGDDSTGRLAGSTWKLEALRYGGDVLVALRRSGQAQAFVDRSVSIAVAFSGSPPENFLEGFVDSSGKQEFRTALRGGAEARGVRAELRIEGDRLVLEAPIR